MSDKSKIQKLAEEAIKLPVDERLNYLKEKAGNHIELVHQATLLIEQSELEKNINSSIAKIEVQVGDYLGSYQILDEIGDGGMGKVFLAEQKHPVQRRVALKVIKLGMDTKDVLARFELERQALAMMSHPNVASVYDAGVTKFGRPFFVMEYVPGLSISKYADQHNLTVEQRIKLMIQTCRGVQHAHQKGIVHRDLKPGNILVTERDSNPIVKIIDFGVAKSTQQKLVNDTVYTKLGVFIGTPHYTSPEQSGSLPFDVDTRADIYSLGVILYELLVGKLPFDPDTFHNKSLAEIQEIICNKDLPTPYDRLKASKFAQKSIAKHRNVSLSELKQLIKGDINCVVMRAIEKNRVERYPSVSAFEADLKNFIEGKPIEARPHSLIYITKKLILRHKYIVGSFLAVVLALALGLTATLLALKQAELEAENAKKQSVLASSLSEVMKGLFLEADSWNQKSIKEITLLQAINNLEDRIDRDDFLNSSEFSELKKLGMDDVLLWNLRKDLGLLNLRVSEIDKAKRNTMIALNLLNENPAENRLNIIKVEFQMVKILLMLKQYDDAQKLFIESVAKINPPQNLEEAKVLMSFHSPRGESVIPLKYLHNFVELAQKYFGSHSEEYAHQLLVLSEWHSDVIEKKFFDQPNLAFDKTELENNFKIAIENSYQAINIAKSLSPPNEDLRYRALRNLIQLYEIDGDLNKAIETSEQLIESSEKSFGEKHARTINAKIRRVGLLNEASSYDQALAALLDVEPYIDRYKDRRVYSFANHFFQKSHVLFLLGQYKESRESALMGLGLNQQELKFYKNFLQYYYCLDSYFLGEFEQAKSLTDELLNDEIKDSDYQLSYYHSLMAFINLSNKDFEQANINALKSLELSSYNNDAYTVLAHINRTKGDVNKSLEYFRKAKNGFQKLNRNDDEIYHWLVSDLVLALLLNGKKQEALEEINTLKFMQSDTVYNAYTQLVRLAVNSVNVDSKKIKINIKKADELFLRIDESWSDKTFHYQYAREALDFIRGDI